MKEGREQPNAERERQALVERLTALTVPLAERIEIARQLFPPERKMQMRREAEKDRKGHPALCFRLLDYAEVRLILTKGEITALDNPNLEANFNEEIARLKLRDEIKKLDPEILSAIQHHYDWLLRNFNVKSYMSFVLHCLPRKTAFTIHATDGSSGNIQGLLSLSIGAPMLPPYDPLTRTDVPDGMPVIEMIIPSKYLLVHPLNTNTPSREMEKEVNSLMIRAEWITDIYQGVDDFNKRFIRDPESSTFLYSDLAKTREGYDRYESNNAYDTLLDWKDGESIADLIPISKVGDLDPSNPALNEPIIVKRT